MLSWWGVGAWPVLVGCGREPGVSTDVGTGASECAADAAGHDTVEYETLGDTPCDRGVVRIQTVELIDAFTNAATSQNAVESR